MARKSTVASLTRRCEALEKQLAAQRDETLEELGKLNAYLRDELSKLAGLMTPRRSDATVALIVKNTSRLPN
jgi:hypothetical protein